MPAPQAAKNRPAKDPAARDFETWSKLWPSATPGRSVPLLKALHILTREGTLNADSRRKLARGDDQRFARLDAKHRTAAGGAEYEIVENKAEIGFAGADIGHLHAALCGRRLRQQGLDKLIKVIDLLEFATAVLIKPPITCEDMQRFEQLDRLPGADFCEVGAGRGVTGNGAWHGFYQDQSDAECSRIESVKSD